MPVLQPRPPQKFRVQNNYHLLAYNRWPNYAGQRVMFPFSNHVPNLTHRSMGYGSRRFQMPVRDRTQVERRPSWNAEVTFSGCSVFVWNQASCFTRMLFKFWPEVDLNRYVNIGFIRYSTNQVSNYVCNQSAASHGFHTKILRFE